MGQAWLDSLSEDWVSQPGSDASLSALPNSPKNQLEATAPSSARSKVHVSRIPRARVTPKKGAKVTPHGSHNSRSPVLSERSFNEINLRSSMRRAPSKLSQEINSRIHGGSNRRSMSESSSQSVVHQTINHKSQSASSSKNQGQTPEWKRRLVYGDLSYGEQRDLFTSAGSGLAAMFKPPAPADPVHLNDDSCIGDKSYPGRDITLPSTPPHYPKDPSTVDIHVDETLEDAARPSLQAEGPKQMRYRLNGDETVDLSRCSDLDEFDVFTDKPQSSDAHLSAFRSSELLESRKVSGQSDMRNEEFSPILLTRRQASNGRASFNPAELPPSELRKRLEKLRQNQLILTSDDEESLKLDRQSEEFEKLGAFVNYRRGGRSADDSFRHHGLSSGLNDTSELAPEESLQASTPKQLRSVRMEPVESTPERDVASPEVPPVPYPSPQKRTNKLQLSAGSPLKLFQPYDTFTSQTLLRRLSQFEDDMGQESSSMPLPSNEDVQAAEPEHGFFSDLYHDDSTRLGDSGRRLGPLGTFGGGRLDGYQFRDDFSMSQIPSVLEDRANRGPDGESIQLPQIPQARVAHTSSPSASSEESLVVHRRRGKSASVSSAHSQPGQSLSSRKYADELGKSRVLLSTPQPDMTEGKRPRNSPAKDPTPKRRRTLHKSDIAWVAEEVSSAVEIVQTSHQQMQSALSKKRKDARQGESHELASLDVLALREILRPRSPTPSQRSSENQSQRMMSGTAELSSRRLQPTQLHALPVGASMNDERKPSIKTEDFLNEANKIMSMIRNKAHKGSGLDSVDESGEIYGDQYESSFEESTKEPFSRPPSREGRPPLSRKSTQQEDPEIVLRLRKYAEASDMGDSISSIHSENLVQKPNQGAGPDRGQAVNSHGVRPSIFDVDEISDPPNVYVTQNTLQERKSSDSLQSLQSAPTASSRGSDSRRVIMPESVEHLIGEQVGNMILDKNNNIWIKQRRVRTASSRASLLQSEGSEDDPFADIPDLTVDMTLELQNLRLATAQKEKAAQAAQPPAPLSPSKAEPKSSMEEPSMDQSLGDSFQPREEDVEHEIQIHEDRGTPRRKNLTISFSSPIASVIQETIVDDAEDAAADESSMQDGGDASFGSVKRGRGRHSASKRSRSTNRGSSVSQGGSQGPARRLSMRGRTLLARPVSRIEERDEDGANEKDKNKKTPAAQMEISVIGESSLAELSGSEDRLSSFGFLVKTPGRPQNCSILGVEAGPIIGQYVGAFSLSPMSEFTMHREETLPLEASYIVGQHHLITGDGSKRVMSMNTRDLVDKLAEVEPFEPHWEDMTELELSEKKLESLHCLDEFCGGLTVLDVSRNNVRNLAGVPASVRHLRMAHNQLSNLTAWGHLMNLQYVDISNNSLTSLSGFRDLVHLRELRVNNNQLSSLDGIKYHDSLQTLYARGNLIETVNLDGANLACLAELDLRGNKIQSVVGIEQLPSLSALDLNDNALSSLEFAANSPLKYLRINGNSLSSLALHHLPNLRLLHADRNSLTTLTGFSRASHLDTLSLREQQGEEPLDIGSLLSRAYEVRKLFLSGNFMSEFNPPVAMLNLQLLELASCGLASLPARLGAFLPNLRVANLNYNALSNLQPLRGIPRLKRLALAGNRLGNILKTAAALATFPHLASVDLRANPVSHGFYLPVQVLVRASEAAESFALPDQDAKRDQGYASRLDLDTRIRRRLYETIFVQTCDRLTKVDGLPLNRDVFEVRDSVWTAMLTRGLVTPNPIEDSEFGPPVVPGSEDDAGYETASATPEPEEMTRPDAADDSAETSTRWEAENSFA